jgi:hypothetical protein
MAASRFLVSHGLASLRCCSRKSKRFRRSRGYAFLPEGRLEEDPNSLELSGRFFLAGIRGEGVT